MEPAMNVFFMVAEAAINQDPPPKGLVVLFDMKGVRVAFLSVWVSTFNYLGRPHAFD